jgi:hypothetical protein
VLLGSVELSTVAPKWDPGKKKKKKVSTDKSQKHFNA